MSEEENALLTWQFDIFATDSSIPSTVQKSMLTSWVCICLLGYLLQFRFIKALCLCSVIIYMKRFFKPNTLWAACMILSDHYKNISSFVCFWFVRKLCGKDNKLHTLNSLLTILVFCLSFICFMNLEVVRLLVIFVLLDMRFKKNILSFLMQNKSSLTKKVSILESISFYLLWT